MATSVDRKVEETRESEKRASRNEFTKFSRNCALSGHGFACKTKTNVSRREKSRVPIARSLRWEFGRFLLGTRRGDKSKRGVKKAKSGKRNEGEK